MRTHDGSRILVVAAFAAALLAAPTAATANPLPSGPARTVIIMQRAAPLPSGAGRRAQALRSEAPLSAAVGSTGGRVLARVGLIDAVIARVTPAQQAILSLRPDVAAVVPDSRIHVTRPSSLPPTARLGGAHAAAAPTRRVYSHACPTDPARPETDPEALTTMSVRPHGHDAGAWQYANGSGVKVGIIAQGIDPDNPDLIRPDGSRVIDDYYDVTGAGTSGPVGTFETVIDTESVAAQGGLTFDLNQEGYSHSVPPGCTLRIVGVAPEATVDVVQSIDVEGNASISELLRAVDHLVTVDHVDVLNESLGSAAFPATGGATDPLALADEAAVAAGVTVVAASGDTGIGNTLSTPADAPDVLAVGGTDQLRALEQVGYAGPLGRWSSGNIANLSSSGIAQDGKTLDVVAPGFYTWVSCTVAARYPDCRASSQRPYAIELAGGTSESAPLVSGVAALIIDAYRRHHHGASPSAAVVRAIITGTADDIGVPTAEQGAGQVDALRAVRAASAWNAGVAGESAGEAQSVRPTQADLIAPVGATTTTSVRITNHGNRAMTDTVTLHSEAPAGVTRIPFTFDQGTAGYQAQIFKVRVPAGTARLGITGLVADPAVGTFLDVYVFDPHGVYVADADPQGLTDSSYVDVARPQAGIWTVKTFGFSEDSPPFRGAAQVDVRYLRPISGGTVEPSRVRLAPGATTTVRATLPAAATAVDGTAALQVKDTANGAVTTVPVAVRRVVPLIDGTGSFAGSLIGGDGRPQGALQNAGVYLDVPARSPALQVHLALPAEDGLKVFAYLVDPDGVAQDREANILDGVPQASIDLATTRPTPGRWRLTVGVDGTLPGTSDTIAYTGSVSTSAPPVAVSGLPRGVTLTAGPPVTATIRVVNGTGATHTYVADAHGAGLTAVPLRLASPFRLPITYENPAPTVSVPPLTRGLIVRAHSADPVSLEVQLGSAFEDENFGQWADPVVLGGVGRDPEVVATGASMTTGRWRVYPQPIRTATATVTLHAWALTAPFAADVTTSTGNPWSGVAGTPLTLGPGRAGDITVTITPRRSASGTIAVETYDAAHTLSSVLAAYPYSYRVG